jgi:sulfoxide reductase catalytic subunit YedY
MPIGRPRDIAPSEITPRDTFLRRRDLLAGVGAIAGGLAFGTQSPQAAKLSTVPGPFAVNERSLSTSPKPR